METQMTIDIEARPEQVWEVIADVERWPEWTASMTSVELDVAELRLGARAVIKQPKVPVTEWTVTAIEPGRSFTWESQGLGIHFAGVHEVRDLGRRGSSVTLTIRQTGPVAFFMKPWLSGMTLRYMEMEAEGLKRRCEAMVTAGPMLAADF